jgi:hypothetical protein
MNDTLDRQLRAIVAAGWRAAVIGLCVYMAAWGIFVALMHTQPPWVSYVWGGTLEWATVQEISIWFFAVLKALWFVFLFGLLFVALLRRQLARHA